MSYQAKNYEHLIGTTGFSDDLLKNHFKLYEGYVTNTNKLIEKLEGAEKGTPEHAELQRRFGWEWNGMRLHELYFGNMTTEDKEAQGEVKDAIENIYGSMEKWREDFVAVGKMRGIGWTILAFDKESGELFNVWINEHDVGHLAGATPLLVMDVFEHAFILDYGMDRGAYIDAFMNAIDWEEVDNRIRN